MRRHLIKRFAFFLLGIVLLYAPFALLTRVLLLLTHSSLQPDVHRVCLRMPIEWLSQPWMYPALIKQPLSLVALLVLPGTAFLFGPLFCGWLCPAGMASELLSRLLPDRVKLNLSGRLNPSPIRYGVLLGTLLSPWLAGFTCCAFCNFAQMQNLVAALFGDVRGLSHWSSFSLLTFALWFIVFGLFMKGGRGWCNLVCPAGAVQGLFHALAGVLNLGYRVRIDPEKCQGCQTCLSLCPAAAISRKSPTRINYHACNTCLDCLFACPRQAVQYRKSSAAPPALPQA